MKKGLSQGTALLRSAAPDTAFAGMRDFFAPLRIFFAGLARLLSDIPLLLLFVSVLIYELFAQERGLLLLLLALFLLLLALLYAVFELTARRMGKQRLAQDSCRVLRDGKVKTLKANALVRGDVLLLSKGDIVPCDLRLCESDNLCVIEWYNGKRVRAVEKDASFMPAPASDVPLQMKKNMLFSQSAVISGDAVAVVLDEDLTVAQVKELLNIPEEQAAAYAVKETRKEQGGAFTGLHIGRWSAFGEAVRQLPNAEETAVPIELSKAAWLMRLIALCTGTLSLILSICAGCVLSDAFLLGVSMMACAPTVLYELCELSAFAVGCLRLKNCGVLVGSFESAEKLSLSRSLLCGGSAAYRVEKMVAQGCYVGRRLAFTSENADALRRLSGFLLAASEVYVVYDRNGKASFAGDREGFAVLEGARRIGLYPASALIGLLERKTEFHDINGALVGVYANVFGRDRLVARGRVSQILSQCTLYDLGGAPKPLERAHRERILENAKFFENNESCRVTAVAYKNTDRGDRSELQSGMVFAGFMVFETRLNYDASKYVAVCRKYGITPVIFSSVVSDMAISDAKKIGALTDKDNYLTARSFAALDKKLYADDAQSYTLYLGLDGAQKRTVLRTKKQKEQIVAAAADTSVDAFDLSEGDVLIACGKDAPKLLRRIADMYSRHNGLGDLYRAVCGCRNIVRSTVNAACYLMTAQTAALVYGLLGVFSAFFLKGTLPTAVLPYLCATLAFDLAILLLSVVTKTPDDLIASTPARFREKHYLPSLVTTHLVTGTATGFAAFLAFIAGMLLSGNHAAGAGCGLLTLLVSKSLLAMFGVVGGGPDRDPIKALSLRMILGEGAALALFLLAFRKTVFPLGFDGMAGKLAVLCAALSALVVLFCAFWRRAGEKGLFTRRYHSQKKD